MRRDGNPDTFIVCHAKGSKKNMKPWKTALASGLCVMAGCIASQKITLGYHDASFAFGQIKQGATVKVVVADNVDLRDFSNSFEKEYQSDGVFIGLVSRQIADSMKSILGSGAVASENPQEAATLSEAGIDEAAVNKIQGLLAATKEDYYFAVNTITIANRRVTTAPMGMVGPAGGGGNMAGGGTSETAMVTMHVDLWNVKDKKKVLSYAASGESAVTMLFYGTALKNAVNEAVGNMVRYLGTGSGR
jgi:hypothetical protein